MQLGARSGGWPLRFDIYEPRWQLIAAAGGATVSGMAGGGPATSGGARGVKRSLTLGRLSSLEIETMECLRDCSGHQSKVTSWHGPGGVLVLSRDSAVNLCLRLQPAQLFAHCAGDSEVSIIE